MQVETETKNIMGVKVPLLNVKEIESKSAAYYGLLTTSVKLDEAVNSFRESLTHIITLAEKMATLKKLAAEISTTKRRVNALNYIVSPRLKFTASFIELSLEEQERETFTRLKHIKQKLEARKGEITEGAEFNIEHEQSILKE